MTEKTGANETSEADKIREGLWDRDLERLKSRSGDVKNKLAEAITSLPLPEAQRASRLLKDSSELATVAVTIADACSEEEDDYKRRMLGLVEAATEIEIVRTLKDFNKALVRHEPNHWVDEGIEHVMFLSATEASVKIGGLSLVDIRDYNPKTSSKLAIFKFLLKSHLNVSENIDDPLSQEEGTRIMKQYPHMARVAVIRAGLTVASLITSDSAEAFSPDNKGGSGLRRSMQAARNLVLKYMEFKRDLGRSLVNPKDPEHKALVMEMARNLEQGNEFTKLFILIVAASDPVDLYRYSEKRIEAGENPEIWKTISENIANYLTNVEGKTRFLATDDLDYVWLNGQEKASKNEKEVQADIKRLVGSITSKTSQKKYDVDPSTFAWVGFTPAQNVHLEMNKSRPNLMDIWLEWVDEEGDVLPILLNIDASRGEFFWNFLADPEQLPQVKSALMETTRNILTSVEKEALRLYEERKSAKASHLTQLPVVPNKPADWEPRQQREGREKGGPTFLETPIRVEMKNKKLPPEIKVIKNEIVPSAKKSWDEVLKGFTPEQQKIIFETIDDYNERGVGQFQQLEYKEGGKVKRFSLRINGVSNKGARVIMDELEGKNGIRKFEVLAVQRRDRAYRFEK